MIETLLYDLLGGAFRLAPEILKLLDSKGERDYELAMQEKAQEFEKIRGAQRIAVADALYCSVRPFITYWFIALYCAAKTATFEAAVTLLVLAGARPSCTLGRRPIRRYEPGC